MKTYIMDDVTITLTEYIEAENEDQAKEKSRAIAYSKGDVTDWDCSVVSILESKDD